MHTLSQTSQLRVLGRELVILQGKATNLGGTELLTVVMHAQHRLSLSAIIVTDQATSRLSPSIA